MNGLNEKSPTRVSRFVEIMSGVFFTSALYQENREEFATFCEHVQRTRVDLFFGVLCSPIHARGSFTKCRLHVLILLIKLLIKAEIEVFIDGELLKGL